MKRELQPVPAFHHLRFMNSISREGQVGGFANSRRCHEGLHLKAHSGVVAEVGHKGGLEALVALWSTSLRSLESSDLEEPLRLQSDIGFSHRLAL